MYVWNSSGTICSQMFGIICISGGHQYLLLGFYQVCTLYLPRYVQDLAPKIYRFAHSGATNHTISHYCLSTTCEHSAVFRLGPCKGPLTVGLTGPM